VTQPTLSIVDPDSDRADRAARVGAMFDRWANDDVSREPDWNVEEFERLSLTRPSVADDRAASNKP
jgi:hypothetical protein